MCDNSADSMANLPAKWSLCNKAPNPDRTIAFTPPSLPLRRFGATTVVEVEVVDELEAIVVAPLGAAARGGEMSSPYDFEAPPPSTPCRRRKVPEQRLD